MPIVWTKNFPQKEKPVGYLRLLLARYRYFNRYGVVWKKGRPKIVQLPGYKHILKTWRNKYKNQRCFIIGNGPSLKKMDLSPLANEITIGCNAIYKNFDEWGWYTKFLLFEDIEQTEIRRHDIPQIKGPIKLAAIYNAYAFKSDGLTYFMNCRSLDPDFVEEQYPLFSEDFPYIVYLGSTVTFIAFQLALHLGCNPVYIIGVDHNYGELPRLYPPGKITITEDNYDLVAGLHMKDNYYKIGDVIGVPSVEYMEAGYRKARQVFEKYNRKIFNAGIDSKLEIFERCSFDSLFASSIPSILAVQPEEVTGKPRVLFISHDAGQLGAQVSLLNLIRQFNRGYDCESRIIIREANGTLLDTFKEEAETFIFWPKAQEKLPQSHQQQIREAIQQWQPHLIFSNTAMNGDVIQYLNLPVTVVVYVHELQWYLSLLPEDLHRAFVQTPALYLAASEAVKRNLITNHHISESKIEVIYETIDLETIKQKSEENSREKIRTQLNIPQNAFVVGNAGRIDERKGWDLFIEIAEKVCKQAINTELIYFLWIGHGPNQIDLIQAAQKKGINNFVKVPGSQENPYPYFKAMDVFLSSSREDPFPLVMLEAAYHGKPILAFADAGGAVEFIKDNLDGYAIAEFSTSEMANRIIQLAQDTQLCREFGAKAKQRVEQEFNVRLIARNIANLLGDRFGLSITETNDTGRVESLLVSTNTHTVSFPANYSLGRLQIRDLDSNVWAWEDLGAAQGLVSIPASKELLLSVDNSGISSLSALLKLKPNDLQSIFLGRTFVQNEDLSFLTGLTGLKTLDLRETAITDTGLAPLAALKNLRNLVLPQQITDKEIAKLKGALPQCHIQRANSPTQALTKKNPLNARIIHFPLTSQGLLMIRMRGLKLQHWTELGPAQGEVSVPSGYELMLVLKRSSSENLSFLTQLQPSDLQHIHCRQTTIENGQLKYLSHFTDLLTLDLRDTQITDSGLARLYSLKSLQIVYLPAQISVQSLNDLRKKLPQARIQPPWYATNVQLSDINPISSMISANESRYLYWLASEYYRGEGEIIDAGCLLGGSTFALGTGLRGNTRVINKSKRIHSYDIFLYVPDFKKNILPDKEFRPGDSLLLIFEENTRSVEEYRAVYAGDFCTFRWTGQPIELLFVDLAKTWQLCNHVIQEFFGHLIPGRSIVIHQDYFHFHCYWIHLTMEFFADYFEILHEPGGGTLGFRLIKAIPEHLLGLDFEHYFTPDQAKQLMDRAIARIHGTKKLDVMTAKMRLLAVLREYEEAAAIGREIRNSTDFEAWLLFDLLHAEQHIPPNVLFPNMQFGQALTAASRNYNILEYDRVFYAVHRDMPHFNINVVDSRNHPQVIKAQALAELKTLINEPIQARPNFLPIVIASESEHNIILYNYQYYRVPLSIKPLDLTLTEIRNQPGITRAETLAQLKEINQ